MMLVVLRNYAEYDDNVTHVKIIEKNLHAVYNVSPRRRGIPSSLYLFVSTAGRKKTVNLRDETRCHSAEGQTDTRCSLWKSIRNSELQVIEHYRVYAASSQLDRGCKNWIKTVIKQEMYSKWQAGLIIEKAVISIKFSEKEHLANSFQEWNSFALYTVSLQLQSITLRKYDKHKEYKDKTKQIIEETIIAYYQQEGQSFC